MAKCRSEPCGQTGILGQEVPIKETLYSLPMPGGLRAPAKLWTGQTLVVFNEVAHHIRVCQGGDVPQAVKLVIGNLS